MNAMAKLAIRDYQELFYKETFNLPYLDINVFLHALNLKPSEPIVPIKVKEGMWAILLITAWMTEQKPDQETLTASLGYMI